MEEEGAGGGIGQYAHDVQPVSRGLDAVKLFVGQLPRQLTEQQLAAVFSEAGTVYEINIIKDKVTKQSRGKRMKFTCSLCLCFFLFFFMLNELLRREALKQFFSFAFFFVFFVLFCFGGCRNGGGTLMPEQWYSVFQFYFLGLGIKHTARALHGVDMKVSYANAFRSIVVLLAHYIRVLQKICWVLWRWMFSLSLSLSLSPV
jgi:hypothetical protein